MTTRTSATHVQLQSPQAAQLKNQTNLLSWTTCSREVTSTWKQKMRTNLRCSWRSSHRTNRRCKSKRRRPLWAIREGSSRCLLQMTRGRCISTNRRETLKNIKHLCLEKEKLRKTTSQRRQVEGIHKRMRKWSRPRIIKIQMRTKPQLKGQTLCKGLTTRWRTSWIWNLENCMLI